MTIEDLPRYRRVQGAYQVLRLETDEDFRTAEIVLRECGISSKYYPPWANVAGEFRIWRNQYRHHILKRGDVITFRRRRDGSGWSVITYRRGEFDCRYEEASA